MALELRRRLFNGEITNYHRVSMYRFVHSGVVVATVESYRDVDHRQYSFLPLQKIEVEFRFDGNLPTLAKQAYAQIKTLDGWQGAEDA